MEHLGVIMLTVAINPFKTNTSFIVHLPILSNEDIAMILQKDLTTVNPVLAQLVIRELLIFFASQTNSLSELRTIRDMVLTHCSSHQLQASNEEEIRRYVASLRESLFVNILPVYSEAMTSIQNSQLAIPLSDFCGVEISLNAKLLLIAGYLCSVYPESEDCHLFGRDDQQHVKSRGRRRRKNAATATISPSLVR